MSTRLARWKLLCGLAFALFLAPAEAFGLSAAEVSVDAGQLFQVAQAAADEPQTEPPGAATPDPDEPAQAAAESYPDPLFDDDEAFEELEDEIWDPLEGMNRTFFGFNRWVDKLLWRPITKGYQYVVPEPGRRAVRRFFLNLGSAPIFVNDLLQLRVKDAGVTLGRFVLNTTLGVGGFFDPAIEAGWERHHSDFGQTLAMMGVGRGPYLVLPVFGPTSTRDGVGDIVDRAFEPLTYIFGFGLLGSSIQLSIGAGNGIVTRDEFFDELDLLEESSIDFYAAIRSVYVQNREAEIWAHLNRTTAAGTAP